jgi:hypothetical protein
LAFPVSSVTIPNQATPEDDQTVLPIATPVEETIELIHEATEVNEEQLPWFRKQNAQRFILVFIICILSSSLAVIFIAERSSYSMLSPTPDVQPSSCNSYRLIHHGSLDEARNSYRWVGIDGDDAVAGSLLFGDLLFFSGVLEGKFQKVATLELDTRSSSSIAISDGIVVAGAGVLNDNNFGTVYVFEKD